MEEQPQGMERRMVHRLLERWRNARKDHELPPLDHGEGNVGFLLGAANCKVKDA